MNPRKRIPATLTAILAILAIQGVAGRPPADPKQLIGSVIAYAKTIDEPKYAPNMSRRQRGLLLDMYETGSAYPLDRNHRRTFDALEERDYIEHVSWGRWRITPLGETIAKQLTAKERNH